MATHDETVAYLRKEYQSWTPQRRMNAVAEAGALHLVLIELTQRAQAAADAKDDESFVAEVYAVGIVLASEFESM